MKQDAKIRIWRARESSSPEMKTPPHENSFARPCSHATRHSSQLALRDARGVTLTHETRIGSTRAKRERVDVRSFLTFVAAPRGSKPTDWRLEFERRRRRARSPVSAREAQKRARAFGRGRSPTPAWSCVGSELSSKISTDEHHRRPWTRVPRAVRIFDRRGARREL